MSFIFFYMYNFNLLIFLIFFSLLMLMNQYMLSIYMVLMNFFLMKMIFFSMKEKMNSFFSPLKLKLIFSMFILMVLFFLTYKLIFMYLYFEIISLMIFLSIYMSSFSMMRLKASMYLIIFMMLSTLPMLIMIFFFEEKFFLIIFSLSFLIKIPILFFHLWLPKAHVEANYYDSMILASLLLKLGGYGILMMNMNFKLNFFLIWNLVGTMLVSILVLFLLDAKMIMAFSSIIHMNMMILMILTNSMIMEKTFSMIMISHALSSSLMFYMVGMVYEQSFSRSMLINKSFMLNYLPYFIMMFFVLLSNMGTPPFLNFFSEMYVYMYMLNYSLNLIMLMMIMLFLSIMFNLLMLKNFGMMVMNKFFKLFNLKMSSMILFMEHMFYLIYFI